MAAAAPTPQASNNESFAAWGQDRAQLSEDAQLTVAFLLKEVDTLIFNRLSVVSNPITVDT